MDDDLRRATFDRADTHLAATTAEELTAAIPACEGWDVARLLRHVGRAQRWAVLALAAEPGTPIPDPPRPGPDEDPVDWYRRGATELTAALEATDLDRPVTSWAGEQTARWWARRMTHEAVIHALDVADATGRPFAVDPVAAVDGVDELLEVFVAHRFALADFAPTGETVHLHATDTEGEWLLTFTADGVEVERRHAKGDVAARGPALDLLGLLWSRRSPEALEVFGDATILDRYQRAAAY
ncbi:MAG: maleylpyruvate isomerase family mycothiol-dependent enzyme [Acidimicrobiia bacterium]|nr:maleylpyruvate isomerase family mycothiol-dependent enzyme [Acidimicrobiia bacterium]